MVSCFCGSKQLFQRCCERLLKGKLLAQSPEELMRSRYSAFATQNESYLLKTWHPETCPKDLTLSPPEEQKWVKLVIHESLQEGNQGHVHFTASSLHGKNALILSEKSLFVREAGQWFYYNGVCEVEEYPVSRNQPCLCGSQKKLKRCCML